MEKQTQIPVDKLGLESRLGYWLEAEEFALVALAYARKQIEALGDELSGC